MKLLYNKINFEVNTISNLPTNGLSDGLTTIVAENGRGGTFIYRSSESTTNNNGTIFDGWCRQYNGAVSVEWFGVIADGVTDNTLGIQAAIDFLNDSGGGVIEFNVGTYISGKIAPRAGVQCSAIPGKSILKLKDNSNTSLVESYIFDTLYSNNAYQISDNVDMTLDYGFTGFIFDGNKSNQTSRIPLIKMYGRRLTLKQCIISNSKGIGLWTALKGVHSGGYDYTKTKHPNGIDEIEFVDCEEEGWVFEGPSDANVGHLVINEIGDQTNNGTVPQTSTMFSGERVHGLRIETSFNCLSLNINGVRFGAGLYVNGRVRINDVIIAGCWGNLYTTAIAEGAFDSILVQSNPYNWNSTLYNSIENNSRLIQYNNVTALRVAGQDQSTVSLIKDSGGAQWGSIKSKQSLSEGGTFFEADSNYISISNLSLSGVNVGLLTNSTCGRISVNCTFSNVNTVWDNNANSIRGDWSFVGSLENGQDFADGVASSPNADIQSLSNAVIDFTQNGSWKSNSYSGSVSFDSTSANGQSIVFTHDMWRQPREEEITLSTRVSGWSSEPNGMSLTLNGFSTTTVTARVKLETPAVGSTVDNILLKINV